MTCCPNCKSNLETAMWDYCPWCGQDFSKSPENENFDIVNEGSAEIRKLHREFSSAIATLTDRITQLEGQIKSCSPGSQALHGATLQDLAKRLNQLEKWAEKQQYDERIKRLETRTKSEMFLTQQAVGEINHRLVRMEEQLKQKNGQPEDKRSVLNRASDLADRLDNLTSGANIGDGQSLQELRELLNRVEK